MGPFFCESEKGAHESDGCFPVLGAGLDSSVDRSSGQNAFGSSCVVANAGQGSVR